MQISKHKITQNLSTLKNNKNKCEKEVNKNASEETEHEIEYSSDDIIDDEEAERAQGNCNIANSELHIL